MITQKLLFIFVLSLVVSPGYGQRDNPFKREVVLFSSDNGLNWQPLSSGLPDDTQASFLAKKGNEIVLATDNRGLFITHQNRTSWKSVSQSLPTLKINSLHISNVRIGFKHADTSPFKIHKLSH
jgi:hypothetical protein